jgi:hypothetical protein
MPTLLSTCLAVHVFNDSLSGTVQIPITHYNKVALPRIILGITLMGPLAVAMYYHLPVCYPPEMQGGHERR